MKRLYQIDADQNVAAGGQFTFQHKRLPASIDGDTYRVARLLIDLELDYDCAQGESVTARQWMEWLSVITCRSKHKTFVPGIDGYELFNLDVLGLDANAAALAALGSSGDETNVLQAVQLVIPFERPLLVGGQHYSIPVELFRDGDTAIRIPNTPPGTGVTINSAILRVHAQPIRLNSIYVPPMPEMNARAGDLVEELPTGVYPELLILAPSDCFAAADITNVALQANGESIHQSMPPRAVLLAFGGDQPIIGNAGTIDWANDAASALFFPLLWCSERGDVNPLVGLADSGPGGLACDLDGALDPVNYVYRRFYQVDDRAKARAANDMNADPDQIRWEHPGKYQGYIPEQIRRSRPGLRAAPAKAVGASSRAGADQLANRLPITRKR